MLKKTPEAPYTTKVRTIAIGLAVEPPWPRSWRANAKSASFDHHGHGDAGLCAVLNPLSGVRTKMRDYVRGRRTWF